jgi:hypothetical protein
MWLANSKRRPCFYPPYSHAKIEIQNCETYAVPDSGVPRNFFHGRGGGVTPGFFSGGRGSTNSVEGRENGDLGAVELRIRLSFVKTSEFQEGDCTLNTPPHSPVCHWCQITFRSVFRAVFYTFKLRSLT